MNNCKWLLLLGICSSYFISPYLPIEWGWENNLLEWLQIAILALGLVLNYKWRQEFILAPNVSNAPFLGGIIPLWFLIISRELSWGKVFYPSGFNAVTGPSFLKLAELPFGPLVYPLLTVVIVLWLYAIIKYGLYKIPYKLLKERRFPIAELIITVLAFVAADVGEHRLHIQSMEELNECLAYLGLILTTYCMKKAL